MTLRCDHCRAGLGAPIHRFWQMRFCSAACMAAYQERLADGTRMKIRRLEDCERPQPHNRTAVWAGPPAAT
jgi:hypothetical protein